MQKSFFLLLLLTLCVVKPAAAASRETVAEDFSAVEQWAVSSGKGYISLCDAPQFVKTGTTSASLTFPASDDGHEMEFVHTNWREGGFPVYTPDMYVNDIGLWVYGCNDPNVALNLQYVDGNGTFLQTEQFALDFDGWKFARFSAQDAHYIYGIMLKSVEKTANPERTVYIDTLTVFHQDIVDLPVSVPENPQTMQLGNDSYLSKVKGAHSQDVGQNGVGVTFMASSEVAKNDSSVQWKKFSPYWVLDENPATKNSSALYTQAEVDGEWLEVILPAAELIQRVELVPAQYGHCFPIDYRLESSIDGQNWRPLASVTDCRAGDQTPQVHSFSPVEAKYIRVTSTKLKPEGNIYYAQFADIRVYNAENENVAASRNGAAARASHPLNGTDFDYDTFYDDVFGLGTNWVNITNEWAYSDYTSGKSTQPGQTEIENFRLLHENQVHILYRFTNAPAYTEIMADRDLAAQRYIAAIEPRVAALRDYVDVWGIFGEINAFEERRLYGREAAENYAYVIQKVAQRIRQLDPDAKINIATALIDFTWTRDMLECGLADVIDVIGIHIYKEQPVETAMPEMAGTFIENGYKKSAEEQPYADYLEEYAAYQALVESYNPDIEIMVTETSVQLGDSPRENAIQAKYLTRQYMVDKLVGAGATFWFTVDPIQADSVVSTLVSTAGIRRPAWYALKNYAAVFSDAAPCMDFPIEVRGNTNDLMYAVFENEQEYLVAYWYALPFRSDFPGGTIDIQLAAPADATVTAADLYTGAEQQIQITDGVCRDLVARDSVTVLRVPKKPGNGWEIQLDSLDNISLHWQAGPAGNLTLNQNTAGPRLKEGKGSMAAYRTAAGTARIENAGSLPALEGKTPQMVSMWVYSQDACGRLSLAGSRDGTAVSSPSQELQPGWQYMTFSMPEIDTLQAVLWDSAESGGTLYMDDIRVMYEPAGAFTVEDLSLEAVDGVWILAANVTGGAGWELTLLIAEYDDTGRMTGAELKTIRDAGSGQVTLQMQSAQKHAKAFVLQNLDTLTPLAPAVER